MKNSRVTKKERGLLKGAVRRVFSRSELRRRVIEEAVIKHKDPARPRVTKWCRCSACGKPTAAYQTEVDHNRPVIAINETLEDLSWDILIEERLWSERENLFAICKPCHLLKSKLENKLRREYKKRLKESK